MCVRALDACVRACVRGWVDVGSRAWACACAGVALLIQNAHAAILSSAVSLAPLDFLISRHKWHDFLKNVTGHKVCILTFSTTFV